MYFNSKHTQNVSNKAKAHAHLNTFGFLLTHIANTKKPKEFKFLPTLKNQTNYIFSDFNQNLTDLAKLNLKTIEIHKNIDIILQ